MKVTNSDVPPIIRKLLPEITAEDYNKVKKDPLFIHRSVRICEECYLSVCSGTPAGGTQQRSANPNYAKNIFKFSKSSNVSGEF